MPHQAILAFIFGIALMAWSPILPSMPWVIFILTLSAVFLLRGWRRFGLLCLGFFWCALVAHSALESRWPASQAGEVHEIEGAVMGLPEWSGESLRFRLKLSEPELPRLVDVRWYRPREHLQPGDVWRLSAALYPPTGRLNFSGFDYERYLLTEGVHATARVRAGQSHPAPQKVGRERGWMSDIHRARQHLAERVQASTTRLEVAALKRALLLGDRRGIDEGLRDLLQATGTAHLLAISGLHVGMMASIGAAVGVGLWAGIVAFGGRFSRSRTALGVGWVFAFGYAALAGFSLPTQRALIMLTVAMVATFAHRRTSAMDGLLLALLIVLLLDPLSILTVGLWLSFAAVAVLIWGFGWRTQTAKAKMPAWSLMRAQWLVMVGLLPISIGVFGQWVPGAFVANVVAIPWVSGVVLPSLLLSTALSFWADSGAWWMALSDRSVSALLAGLDWLERTGWSAVTMAPMAPSMMMVGVFGALWWLAPPGFAARGLGGVLLLGVVMTAEAPRHDRGMTLTVFDVGSGLAAMIEQGSYRMLFDTGPGDGAGRDVIGDILAKQAKHPHDPQDRWVINDLVMSWDHRGHRGGLASVLSLGWVRRVHQSFGAVDIDAPSVATVHRCQRGASWRHGVLRFAFLHPGPRLPALGGNSSCVLLVTHPKARVLIVSGLDAVGEAHVLQMHQSLKVDALIVARSGHADTTSTHWLNQLAPRHAVISVSMNDRFQRPDRGVIDRLLEAGVELHQTAHCGAVSLTWTAESTMPTVTTAIGQRRRFWHSGRNC